MAVSTFCELYSMLDLVQVEQGRMKKVLDELLNRLIEMSSKSSIVRDWLLLRETTTIGNRGANGSQEIGAATLQRPREDEMVVFRSLLGMPLDSPLVGEPSG